MTTSLTPCSRSRMRAASRADTGLAFLRSAVAAASALAACSALWLPRCLLRSATGLCPCPWRQSQSQSQNARGEASERERETRQHRQALRASGPCQIRAGRLQQLPLGLGWAPRRSRDWAPDWAPRQVLSTVDDPYVYLLRAMLTSISSQNSTDFQYKADQCLVLHGEGTHETIPVVFELVPWPPPILLRHRSGDDSPLCPVCLHKMHQ